MTPGTSFALHALACVLAVLAGGCATVPTVDRAALDELVARAQREPGGPLEISVWLGGFRGAAWYQREADRPRPTASAIKTAYLIEFFAAQPPEQLDSAQRSGAPFLDQPPPGAAALLQDEAHPAWQPFPAADRAAIRAALAGASVRRIGQIMMGTAPAPNAVYNGAANLIAALLGGPAALTARMHQRDPAFAGLWARRYMLARRDVTGDNEAPAAALAAVLQRLAGGALTGVPRTTLHALRGAVLRQDRRDAGTCFYKDGDLDSDPMVQVRSGFCARGLVYVVTVLRRSPGAEPREVASRRLEDLAGRLTDQILDLSFLHEVRFPASRRSL